MNTSKNLRSAFVAIFIFVLFFAIVPLKSSASSCSFEKDMEMKTVGEDVRCLQKYLNSTGFTIAQSGVGSPGKETSIFGELTKQAVKKWQASNGISATGNFGPLSRKKFASLSASAVLGATSLPVTTGSVQISASQKQDIQSKISSILTQIENLKAKRDKITEDKITKTEAEYIVNRTQTSINTAQTEVNNAYSRGDDVDKANDYIRDAKDKMKDVTRAYNKDQYTEVESLAYETEKLVDKSLKEIDSSTVTMIDVKDEIDNAKKLVPEAEDKITKADQNGYDVTKSESKLKESQDALDKANNYYDNRDYNNAMTYAEDAKELANAAVDAIDDVSKSEARTKINEAEDAIDEAQDDIDYAKDRNRSIGNANNILNTARAALTTARNYYNEKNYSSAVSYSNKSLDYTNDALDQF